MIDGQILERDVEIKMPEQFEALWIPIYRHIVYYGGRSAAKSYSICLTLLLKMLERKILVLCVREVQRSIEDSVHRLMVSIIEKYDLPGFIITKTSIRHENGSEVMFKGLKLETADSLKSIPDVDYCFVEEAQSVSKRSITILVPTIRKEGSQIIWAYNPDTLNDPVKTEIVDKADEKTFVCKINSQDVEEFLNPTIIEEREKMKREDYSQYLHVWMGEPRTQAQGSIYAEYIGRAKEEGRISSHVAYDDSVPVFTAWDLGISDTTAIIFAQKVGNEIHIIDYYEDSGRALSDYIDVVKQKPYHYEKHILPHDARARELQTGKSREDFFHDMGIYNVTILSANSVENGINAVRSAMSRVWINEDKCDRLIQCLKEYHYEWDDKNQMLHKTPKHDWTSHASDAMRYLIEGINASTISNHSGIRVKVKSGTVSRIIR